MHRPAPAARPIAAVLFSALTCALVGLAALLPAAGQAAALDEGIDYAVLNPPQPTETGDKVEVVEVFWYGCPHCWHLEPVLKDWAATMPEGAAFRRMPATGSRWTPHARAYYAAEAMGKLDAFHEPLFKAMQVDRRRIVSEDDLVKFAGEVGLDTKEFQDAYNSFYVEAKVRKAEEMGRRYGIDGVPAVVINGKYRTSPSQTGGQDRFVEVLNALVAKEIEGAKAAAPSLHRVAGEAPEAVPAQGS